MTFTDTVETSARTRSLLLLRHGQSTWNAEGLWQGWADPPLTELGRRDALAAAEGLRPFRFVKVHSSDLARAAQTAEIVASALGLDPPTVHPSLRERDVGEWAGLGDEQIEARWPGKLDEWRGNDAGAPAGGGENAESVVARLSSCLRELFNPLGPVLVVSHIGAIRALEESLGAPNPPIPNLGGRWLTLNADGLRCGERFEQPEVSDTGRL